MLAVLPFANLSGDPTQEYFSDGLTEAVIAELGRLHPQRLGVIARTSSMAYKGRRVPIAEIGRELAVDFVLEGSLRRSSQRVTVTAQLIEVRDQTQRWSRDFDRELRDVVTLQKDIARAVAHDIRLQLTSEERTRLTAARPVDTKAHEHYLQGRFLWNKRTEEALLQAIERFKQAIAIDPSYALAHAALADCYGPMVYMGYLSPVTALSNGKPATLRALELDDALAEAHTSLGNFKGSYEWDWSGAEKELVRALDFNPSYATGHDWYAQYPDTGRTDGAGPYGRGAGAGTRSIVAGHQRWAGQSPVPTRDVTTKPSNSCAMFWISSRDFQLPVGTWVGLTVRSESMNKPSASWKPRRNSSPAIPSFLPHLGMGTRSPAGGARP